MKAINPLAPKCSPTLLANNIRTIIDEATKMISTFCLDLIKRIKEIGPVAKIIRR